MPLSYRLKSFLNAVAGRYGYHIEKIVDYGDNKLNILHVLIDQLAPSNPNFFFVQVGANDGRNNDPIYPFVERYHWRGVLLEPQPITFGKLTENYHTQPQLILENAAIAWQDGTLSLWTKKDSDLLSSFDRSVIAASAKDLSAIVEIPVQAVSFRTLVQRHNIDHIDLLVIDTEGFDYEVIRMALTNDLPLPRLIQYEHLHLSAADRTACARLLAEQGYALHRADIDTIAFQIDRA